jgi:hypothetical protein
MFGYFSTDSRFTDLTDIDLKAMMFQGRMDAIEQDIVPFGFHDNNDDYIDQIELEEKFKDRDWHIPYEADNNGW